MQAAIYCPDLHKEFVERDVIYYKQPSSISLELWL